MKPVRVLAIFPIDVARVATAGLRERCAHLLHAARGRGLFVDAAFAYGRRVYWCPDGETPIWPDLHEEERFAPAAYRTWGMFADLRSRLATGYDVVWIRGTLATPASWRFIREAARGGARVVVDLPTYPYAHEATGWLRQAAARASEGLYRSVRAHLARVVTNSAHDYIWGVPTLRVRNGIDERLVTEAAPDRMPAPTAGPLHFVGFGQWARWHGLHRLLRALAAVERQDVRITLGGDGPASAALAREATRLGLPVTWLGPVYGQGRARLLASGDVGIGTLGHGDDRLTHYYPLKHRLYAAAGLPFVATARDPVWEGLAGVYAVPGDHRALDPDGVMAFARAARAHRGPWGDLLRARVREQTWTRVYAAVWDYFDAR